jgi:hypothetical protein
MKSLLSFILFLASANLFAQQDSTADPLQSMVLSVCNKVESEDRLAGNMDPDSAASLPFGIVKEIGITRYIIAIDSAKFQTSHASFSAYMALEFPGAQQKICFSAQNIAFNPKGVMPGPNTRLVLVSEHRISLGPHLTMVLKPDGYNYVEWDCNGFSSVNLKGYFEFDPGMIYPDPATSSDSVVRASFQVHVNDLHNFVVQTSLAPFCIRGIDDLSFTVLDATADFSELSNAPAMIFPVGYNLANCNGDPLMWTGFYMRQFRVKLPKELSKNGNRPEILATNLLIDNSGVSGLFQAVNLFSTKSGSMNGWGFSVASIGAAVTSNQLNGGNISGFIKLPVSENDSLAYTALFFQNLQTHQSDYSFSISPKVNFKAEVLSSTLTLLNTSTISVNKVNGKLKPLAVLNGLLTLNSANAKAHGISFQQLTLASEAPLLRAGTFSLVPTHPDSSQLGLFNFSINSIVIGILNNQPAISFSIGMNFAEPGDLMLSANGGFTIVTQTNTVSDEAAGADQTKQKWEFDHVRIDNIGLAFNANVFHLNGMLLFKDNDPIYGKGFYGQLAMTIENVMPSPASSAVWFGKINNYRYFYVDAAVPIPVPLSGVTIYRFMGGIYYHMHRNGNNSLENQLYTPAFGSASAYVPDNATSLGIKAGVTLGTSGNPKPCNGDVALEMNFNSNGGINYLQLSGNVYFMIGINERQNKQPAQVPAIASMQMQFDFQNSAFHAVLGAQLHVPGVTGSGTTVIHFDPNLWYVHIGRPQSRVNVNVAGIANFNSYFETGQFIDPMPPPPQEVTSVVNTNGLNDQRNETALANAGGFAFGAGFGTAFNGQVGFEHWYIYYNFSAGAGFDIMILDYGPNAHCENSTAHAGFEGWYASGQIYAYLQGAVGIHGHVGQDFDFTLVTLSAAAILQARVPNPNWVGGAMGCDYDVLGGIVSGHCDFAFQAGSQCNILPN